MKRTQQLLVMSAIIVFSLYAMWGCDDDVSNGPGGTGPELTDMTCIGCHSDKDMLIETADEEAAKVGVPNKGDG